MSLELYNTLTEGLENFKSLDKNAIRMYTCGPTVYDVPHVGNYRAFLFFDFVKRYLRFLGYDVTHVMNITDVDDKIIARCDRETISLEVLTSKFTEAFKADAEVLGIALPELLPKATDHIGEMIDLIKALIEKNHAYTSEDGSVFFKIDSFGDYGNLSGIKLDQLASTERVADDEYGKESPQDFALWKKWKEEDGEIGWDSPWGRGRPGWHIECSAMSMKYLGEEFDIHCGGVDLLFPHHENEIAQSVCGTGKSFVQIWMHCEHLLVDGAKMSKSLGNFYTIGDLTARGHSAEAIRYLLTSSHYRQKVDLTEDHLRSSGQTVQRFHDFKRRLLDIANTTVSENPQSPVLADFTLAMNDDLNVSKALAVLFDWVRETNRKIDSQNLSPDEAAEAFAALDRIDSVFCFLSHDEPKISDEDRALIRTREAAREAKNWSRSDQIREIFRSKGYELEDTPKGTLVKRIQKPSSLD
ncbi:MAG: cysteine--tRNA ligase [Candidatus Neomarinimicrobiota bacterium]|nr:cysteine--tRNA ligase [Candidatus Neomarinimicrobiota bacterium]